MHLIVGLGNPGKKYTGTRHNFGYMIVDSFAKDRGLSWRYNPDWTAYYIKSHLKTADDLGFSTREDDFVLLKPATFMNHCGVSVSQAANFFKIETKEILAIHDELDLPFGKIRFTFDSMSAGHRGVDSMIESLAGVEFGRLRLGIGKPVKKTETEKYVLRQFTNEEGKKLKDVVEISKEAIKSYLADGIDVAMNRFN